MKTRTLISFSSTALVLAGAVTPLTAADYYWDNNGATAGIGGASGAWDTTTTNWSTASAGNVATVVYPNAAGATTTAHFGGTAGTVTIASGTTINVNSLVFDSGASGSYTIAGTNSTSILNFTGTAPSIVNNFGGIQKISAKITGTSGFTLTGGNFTVLQGDLSGLTGTVNVNGRINLHGATITGTQNQTWNIGAGQNLTTNNLGAGSTIQLGALSGSGTLRPGNDNSVSVAGVDNFQIGALNTDTTFSGNIVNFTSGVGTMQTAQAAITKVGSGKLTLTGTGNTYSGGTTINAGTLAVSQSGGLGTGGINFTGNSTLQAAGSTVTLNNAVTLGTSSVILDTNGNTLNLTGGISNSGATDNAIKAAGSGTLTLGGTLNITGHATDTNNPALMLGNRNGANFNRGTVNITGTGAISRISTGWDNTANTLNFASTGTVTMSGDLVTGQSANGVGVVNHTTGTLTTQNVNLANWDGSFGAYNMSGGTLNTVNLRNGGNGNGNGNSYMVMSGGTVNVSTTTTFSRNGNGTNVLNLTGAGAQFNAGTGNVNLAFSADSTGIVTVGAGLMTVNSTIFMANGGTSSTYGIVNLNGGTLRTNAIASANASGNSIVNFNGGTLQANSDNAGFLGGLTSANIYSGGATIDTNGKNVTVSQVLRGATGNGVNSTIPITNGGSGYLSAPVVKITGGGGTGATAVAIMSGGVVTGIQVTSAGTGYTSAPTVSLVGGGATTAATLGTITTVANSDTGGFTKTGSGVLTLSGANTYGGATAINGGVLATNNLQANGTASGIGQGTALNINGGTLRYTGAANANGFNRTINVGAGGGTLDNQGGQFVFYSGSLTGSGAVNFVDSSGSNHEWLVTGNSAGFSGNVGIGNGAAGSGLVQYRSNNANPLGTGTVTINGGGVLTADGGTTTPTTLGNNLVLNGGLLGTQGPAMAYTGTIFLAASSTVGAVPGYGTNAINLTGAISGGSSAALNIATTSEVTISNNGNTYTGATNVISGKLLINGNISTSILTTVSSGATIGGVGTVGDLTVLAGATFDPGNSIGTLTSDGTLSLAGNSAFEINTIGNLSDLAIATGLLNFGGTLNVTNIGGALQNGATFNLFDWGSAAGTFANVNLPTLDGNLSWDQSNLYVDGTLAIIPEPKAALLGGWALLVLLRRHRQNKG
jgi:autotransporter-associated beta strand protein